MVKKYTNGDDHLVDLKVTVEDQHGVKSIPDGRATVILLSRQTKSPVWPT